MYGRDTSEDAARLVSRARFEQSRATLQHAREVQSLNVDPVAPSPGVSSSAASSSAPAAFQPQPPSALVARQIDMHILTTEGSNSETVSVTSDTSVMEIKAIFSGTLSVSPDDLRLLMCDSTGSKSLRIAADDEDIVGLEAFLLDFDVSKLFDLVPLRCHSALAALGLGSVVELVFDLDRPPRARIRGENESTGGSLILESRFLSQAAVSVEELLAITKNSILGPWTSDNRSGIRGTLHRVSRIVDNTEVVDESGQPLVVGMTVRIGRHRQALPESMTELVQTLLSTKGSLLLLGPPGVGKTTVLRQLTRYASDDVGCNVVVVDTSSELGGVCWSPHSSLGLQTRRMKVSSRPKQHEVLLEAVQNHTPDAVVVDEIGSEAEVHAASSIAARGISMIASAHATELSDLINNPVLQPLIGGVEMVTVGDLAARMNYGNRKVVQQRQAQPVFCKVVEVREPGKWFLHEDVAKSIDELLATARAEPIEITSLQQGPSNRWRSKGKGNSRSQDQSGAEANEESDENVGEIQFSSGLAGASLRAAVLTEMRSLRDSGGVYRLSFDGGVNVAPFAEAWPGGAGAALQRVLPRLGSRSHRMRTELLHSWMYYSPDSTVDQMEYAALLMGLQETSKLWSELKPSPKMLLVEGDSRIVTEQVGLAIESSWYTEPLCAPVASVFESTSIEELHARIERLVHDLQFKVKVWVQWRPRRFNKLADKLTHQARKERCSTDGILLHQSSALLKASGPIREKYSWFTASLHPKVTMDGQMLPHPRQSRGFVGIAMSPHPSVNISRDGMRLTVRIHGLWGCKDSFLIGIGHKELDLERDVDTPACSGLFFSPKSGHVVGCGRINYLLKSLEAPEDELFFRDGRGSLGLELNETAGLFQCKLKQGHCWGFSYRVCDNKGRMELFHADPDGKHQSLGVQEFVNADVPAADCIPMILFKPRQGSVTPYSWTPGKGGGRSHPFHHPFIGRGGRSPATGEDSPAVEILETRNVRDSHPFQIEGTLDRIATPERVAFKAGDLVSIDGLPVDGKLIELEYGWRAYVTSSHSQRNWVVELPDRPRRVLSEDEFQILNDSRDQMMPPIASIHPLLDISGRSFRFPKRSAANDPSYNPPEYIGVQFKTASRMNFSLTVRISGFWASGQSFLIGLTRPETGMSSIAKEHAELFGWFLSPKGGILLSRTTNEIFWPLMDKDDTSYQGGTRNAIGLRDGVLEPGSMWNIRLSEGSLTVSCSNSANDDVGKLGVAFSDLDGEFYPTLIFKPKGAVHPGLPRRGRKGGGKYYGGKGAAHQKRWQSNHDPPFLDVIELRSCADDAVA